MIILFFSIGCGFIDRLISGGFVERRDFFVDWGVLFVVLGMRGVGRFFG